MQNRRQFVKNASLAIPVLSSIPITMSAFDDHKESTMIACQQYTWFTYFRRENKEWMNEPDESLKALTESGLKGYEPSFNSPEEVQELKNQLDKHQLWSRSMYVNSVLHEPELVEKNIASVISIAREAVKNGIDILVTNPTPIKWGGPENKNDEQLKTQSIALNLLGKQLKEIGMTLAYHNHDAEMREGAREFHHMLHGTDPENVKLCLDAHWIYRGAGNSSIALFDITDMYMERIVELHLRQSNNGIWSETFGEGDIDYSRLAKMLSDNKINPHLVLEQAVEEGTPNTMNAIEAIGKSLTNVKAVFG